MRWNGWKPSSRLARLQRPYWVRGATREVCLCRYQQAASSPAAVIDGSLELIVEGEREEKLTARARRAALGSELARG
eukprot:6212653-Pleurochrysis_carterae.AAC.2